MEQRLAECEAYGVSRDTCYKAERDDARSYQEQSHIRYDRALKAAEEVRLRRKAKSIWCRNDVEFLSHKQILYDKCK